jgi:hypothetical protein
MASSSSTADLTDYLLTVQPYADKLGQHPQCLIEAHDGSRARQCRVGNFARDTAVFYDDPSLWEEFCSQLLAQVRNRYPDLLTENGELESKYGHLTCVYFQVDTRPPGCLRAGTDLNEADQELNASAMIFHNFNMLQASRDGIYLFFRADSGAFKACSMYWLCGIIFLYVRIAFRQANIMYVDSDACALPLAVQARLEREGLWNVPVDTIFGASDVDSPFNAGWMFLRKASKASLTCTLEKEALDQEFPRYNRTVLDGLQAKRERVLAGNGAWYEVDTYPRMCAALLASVWSYSGLDTLRPSNVDEVLQAWMAFQKFGALHWRSGRGDVRASPAVEGNAPALEAAKWARSAYEQFSFTWVHRCVVAAGSPCLKFLSGEGGLMICRDFEDYFQLPSEAWAAARNALGKSGASPHDWRRFFAAQNFEHCKPSEGDQHFPGTIHLYGHTKRFHKDAVRVLLAYELLHDRSGSGTSASQMPLLYLPCRDLSKYLTSWSSKQHSDVLVEECVMTSEQPRHLVLYCRGLSRRLVPKEWFPNSFIVCFGSKRGFGATGLRPDEDANAPGYSDETDKYVCQLLAEWGEEFAQAGALPFHEGTPSRRIVLCAAHFRPVDAVISSILQGRLRLLREFLSRLPSIENTLLVGESAGTHTQ